MLHINICKRTGIRHQNSEIVQVFWGRKICKAIVQYVHVVVLTALPFYALAVPTGAVPDTTEFERSNSDLRYSVPLTEEEISWVDETNDFLSELVLDFSESIDHGLAKADDEEPLLNKSYIKIISAGKYSHRGDLDTDESIAVRIDLPHTEHNWKIIFETDPDDYDDLESKQRGLNTSSPDSKGAFGGIRLQDEQISHWRTSFDIGIKIRLPLDPFARTEIYRVAQFSESWTTKVSQEFFYFNSKGLGSLSALNFYYDVNEAAGQIFTIGTSAQYLYDDDRWEVLHQAQYFDRLNEKQLLQYSLGISVLPYDEDEVSNIWLSASWIQKLYKNWLFLTVTPQLEVPREYDYKLNPGIFVEFEAFFSKNRKVDRLNRFIPEPTRNLD
ncbi:hypothetical protein HUO09_12925 [Vibrio sp. Y2-5]|uniref:hypothetical protein n=1 Tax=Vibrio TaxID=662 RepID=UPI00142E88F9|nr:MULTISPECIES: hypothetical protein [Vibrio]MBD0787250.1 hypothetical protein [Vibrio sp. Y2-5]NIY92914.1 hypothetical protein [Vibrio diazotrophicus]